MVHGSSYKLGSYKITEIFGGGLWWESHHALGATQKGKCLIEGNILILGPSEIEEPGFLKREFVDQLNKLPNWDKTRYYCLSHSIRNCRTGRQISIENKTDDRLRASLNAVKVPISDSVENKRTINKQPDARKEFVNSKEIIVERWDILKNCLIRIGAESFNILKKISSKYRG